ncbi:FRIGIDA-like protein 5 [Bienertia sinuspersici]
MSERLELKEEEIESHCREVEVKEKELNERFEELKAKEKQLNQSCDVLELQGKKVDDHCQMLELKEKEVDELHQEMAIKEMQLKEDCKALVLRKKRVNERCKKTERKEKESMKMIKTLNNKCSRAERKIVYLAKELKWKEKELSQFKESKENQIDDPCQLEEFRDKQIVSWSGRQPDTDISQVSDTVDSLPSNTGVDLHPLCKNMDVEGVRSYLMERVQEQKTLQKKMLDALRCAPDPAKLALDVFRSFHRILQNKCQVRANKTSCIFLLKQLLKLSPPLTYDVKVEARKFADYFRGTLKGSNSATDSFGFLLLLATFKLGKMYRADDLLSLFNVFYNGDDIYQLEENSYLCYELGLLNKIPDHVTSLIERKKRFLAIRYICIFKLQHEFPLKPLLEAQLTFIKKRANDRRKVGTSKSKLDADYMERSNLHELMKHVKVFNLEAIFPIGCIVSRINELEKEKEARRANVVAPTKKRCADSCASASIPNQLEKRPRVEDTQQVAPPPCPQPVPYDTLGHATQINLNAQPTWQQQGTIPAPNLNALSYGVGPHIGSPSFVPPGVVPHPLGAPRPFY